MPTINTLIPDIYKRVGKKDDWFTEALSKPFGIDVATRVQKSLGAPERSKQTLRLSNLGISCPKALWHSIHTPELAEPLPPWAEVKFAFGHILEALAITLAKAAGHLVVGEQDAVYVDGITGHRDCVIDGCVVDVKSCSSRAFDKLKNKSLLQNDSFGYLDQLDGYLVGSLEDPLVTCKDTGYILGIDKTLGHMILYKHGIRENSIRERIRSYKEIVGRSTPPECKCGTRPQGKSGNIELDVKASYSAFKFTCFPNLRVFLYSSGPVYLTKINRKPDVIEVDRQGKIVYN